MGLKLMMTGILLAIFLMLPATLKGLDVPDWFKAVVLVAGFSGLALIFVGALWLVWE